jgi:hypothetical protein
MPVNVLDPDLSFLASEAAVEIDSFLNGNAEELASVTELAKRLQQSIDRPNNGQAARGLLADTATETVLGQAMNLVDQQHPLKNVNELLARTEKIAEQLSNAATTKQDKELRLSQAFCLALSRCAAAYRKSVHDLRQPHPYRR